MKTTARRLRAPAAGSALTMAVCAALGTGPAEAIPEITPVNQQLGQFNVDFNHDGTPEFTLSFLPTFGENDVDTFLNEVVGFPVTSGPKPGPYGSALPPGTLIDGSLNYISGQSVILKGFNTITGGYGQFFGSTDEFLGLMFHWDGESGVHYGWVELRDPPGGLTVVAIGYETAQNTGIVTPSVPEPGTLALLAAGAAGVLALRRRQRSA